MKAVRRSPLHSIRSSIRLDFAQPASKICASCSGTHWYRVIEKFSQYYKRLPDLFKVGHKFESGVSLKSARNSVFSAAFSASL